MYDITRRATSALSVIMVTFLVAAALVAGTTVVRDMIREMAYSSLRDRHLYVPAEYRNAYRSTSAFPVTDMMWEVAFIPPEAISSRLPVLHTIAAKMGPPFRVKLTSSNIVVDRVVMYVTAKGNFAPLWDWNTKIIYVAFVISYASMAYSHNEIVIYDRILRSRAEAEEFSITEAARYPMDDIGVNQMVALNTTSVDGNGQSTTLVNGVAAVLFVKYQVMSFSGYAPVHTSVQNGQMAFFLPCYSPEDNLE